MRFLLQVGDGTDGKLVHLDGLNFSRAWGLYRIASRLGGEEGQRLETAFSIIHWIFQYAEGTVHDLCTQYYDDLTIGS